MSGHRGASGVLMVALLLASALTAVAAALVGAERIFASRVAAAPSSLVSTATTRTPGRSADSGGLTLSPSPPLGDAETFRFAAAMAIEADAPRERRAHPRELATYHYLRSYPGAPPRVPHGLTPDEFRTGTCNTCHERGGYSGRFAAYVPVTPHPDLGFCLQCHVGNDAVTGIQHPSSDPNARCRQCHTPSGPPRTDLNATLDWPAPTWPPLGLQVTGRDPPTIPHELQTRGNCLACHAGPAAVAEIRTTHPEWRACPQCHVAAGLGSPTFTRAAADPRPGTGGTR